MKLKKTSSSGNTLNNAYKRYELIGAFNSSKSSTGNTTSFSPSEIVRENRNENGQLMEQVPSLSSHGAAISEKSSDQKYRSDDAAVLNANQNEPTQTMVES